MGHKNWRNMVITATDGAGAPVTLTFTYDGNLSLNIPVQETNFLTDRGDLPATPEITLGAELPMTGSFDFMPADLYNAAAIIPADFAFQAYADWQVAFVSTATGEDCCDLAFTDGTDTITCPDSVIRAVYDEGGEGGLSQKLTYSFVCPHPRPTMS